MEFSLTPTVSRETSTRENRRLAGEWAIQSTRRVASPEVAGAGDGEGRDGEMARGLGVLSLGDEGGGGDEKEAASTGGRNKTKVLGYGEFPIFQPPPGQMPREIDTANKKMKTPPLQTHKTLVGFLSPDETEKAYTNPRKSLDKKKSPFANKYTFNSDSDTPTADQPPTKPPPPSLNQTLYARGLCPSCLHPRSKIEALRCGRCHAHLSVYNKNSIKNISEEPSRTQRPTTPLSTAPLTKSPPPLRERVLLSQSRSASVSRERYGRGNGHERVQAPSPAPALVPKRRSASLRDLAVSPTRDYTYLPLVGSERQPLLLREVGQSLVRRQGEGVRSRSRSRGMRREGVEGVGLGLGLVREEEDPRYVAEGEDADLLVSIYEE